MVRGLEGGAKEGKGEGGKGKGEKERLVGTGEVFFTSYPLPLTLSPFPSSFLRTMDGITLRAQRPVINFVPTNG